MRSILWAKLIPLLGLALCVYPSILSSSQSNPEQTLFARIDSVSCYGKQGKVRGSRTTEGQSLLSPDGKRRATVVVKTKYDPEKLKNPEDSQKFECSNTSQLMISEPAKASGVAVFTAPPPLKASEPGNDIELADWSKDSRYLAATYLKWAYFSDWFHFDLLVYDSQTKKMLQPDIESMFTKRFGKQCSIQLRALGFDEDGVSPVIEAWDNAEEASCVAEASLWHVDLRSNTVVPVPKGFRVSHFARASG